MSRMIVSLFLLASLCLAETPEERAARIHRDAIVVDMHADTLMRVIDAGYDMGVRNDVGDLDLPRMREGGLDCEFFSIFPGPDYRAYGFFRRANDMIEAYMRMARRYPKEIVLATTVEEVRAAAAQGKLAGMLGVEGGHAIENDPRRLEAFAKLGVRYMTVTWSFSLDWAGSSGDKKGPTQGLTPLGRRVISEMNRLGMAVDLSHVSDRTFFEAVAASSKPVVASHSNCRALAGHPRNMTDDMLRAVADKGGVVGVNFYPCFLDDAFRKDFNAFESSLEQKLAAIAKHFQGNPTRQWLARADALKRESRTRAGRVTVSRLAEHIDHMVKVAGVDHVGLGSDFDGIDAEINGLEDCSKLPAVTAELLRRGYTESDVRKILGENFLRVYREIIGR